MTAEEYDKKQKEKQKQHLTWRDYVALIIAMLTTTLLPLLIFMLIIIAALVVILVALR